MISQSCCKFGKKKKTRWFVFAANDERSMQIVNRPLSSFITRSISSCPSENSGIACDFLFESDSRTFRYKPSVPKRRKQYVSANKWTRLRHYISQTAAHTAFSWTENGGLATLSEHEQQWNADSKHRTIIITRQTSAARQPTSSLPLFREFRDGRLTKTKLNPLWGLLVNCCSVLPGWGGVVRHKAGQKETDRRIHPGNPPSWTLASARSTHSTRPHPLPLGALELRMFRNCCCTAGQRRVTQKKKHQVLVVRNSPQTWLVLNSKRISPCDPPHPPPNLTPYHHSHPAPPFPLLPSG